MLTQERATRIHDRAPTFANLLGTMSHHMFLLIDYRYYTIHCYVYYMFAFSQLALHTDKSSLAPPFSIVSELSRKQ